MRLLTVSALVVGLAGLTSAQDKDKPNPTGTWKWTTETGGGQKRDQPLKLKLEGDKLTGALVGRDNTETKIEEAKYKEGELSFTVTRERGGQKIVSKYSGKLSGDTIKGTIESDRDGKAQKRDWEAKREKVKD
jgi:hypothetical protein